MMTMTPFRSSSVPTLGPLERDVLEAVWCISATGQAARGPASDTAGTVSIREVHERLGDRGLAYTTISTVLTNLEKKGVIERASRGRPVQYRAIIGRDEYSAALMNEALSYSRDRRASILHFVCGMDESDVEALRELVERTGGRHPDSPAAGTPGSPSSPHHDSPDPAP